MRRPPGADWTARLLVALVAVGILAGAACGDEGSAQAQSTDAKDLEAIDAASIPGELMGLKVAPEDVKESIVGLERSYLDALGLFSLRKDKLLQATLQVARFNDEARYEDSDFRRSLLNQVGGTVPRAVQLGDDTVYLTTGTKQRLAIWFRDDHLVILATRDEFDRPRTLLRQVLEIDL